MAESDAAQAYDSAVAAPAAAAPKAAAKPAKKATSFGDVGSKIQAARDALAPKIVPNLHSGGPVLQDGPHNLKAGEHVLTAKEADKARKHALMASGMKSLAKTPKEKK